MKKIYLVLLAGFALNSATAQMVQPTFAFGESNRTLTKMKPTNKVTEKVNFWDEDFNIGATAPSTPGPTFTTSNGVWTTGGANGNIWKHSFYPSDGEWSTGIAPFASTTASNGYMLFDADSINEPLSPAYITMTGELISPVITACATEASVMVVLEQEFRYCCAVPHQLNVQVSTDGGMTWSPAINLSTGIDANDTYSDITGGYSASANISAYAAMQPSVMLKFTWAGDASGSSHYYWMLDDIGLTQAPTNDLVAYDPYWGTDGLFYHQIPTTQVAPIDFQTVAFNNGVAAQTNVTLDVDINAGAWTGTSNVIASLAPNTYDTCTLATPWTPAATVGTHNITWMLNQTETEESPADNTNAPITVDITNWIYARDDGTQSSNRYNQGEGYEIGHLYDIWADQTLYSVDVDLSTFTEVGSIIQAKVYAFDGTAPDFASALTQVGISDYYNVAAGDLNGILTIPLLAPVNLTNAQLTYLVTVASDGNGGTGNDMVVNAAGNGTSYFYDAPSNSWTSTGVLAMVRMNFENSAGLEEVNEELAFRLFPNPATDNVTIDYTINNASDVTIALRDVTGSVVATEVNNGQTSGVHTSTFGTAALSSGVYYITITSNDTSVTKKFMKK